MSTGRPSALFEKAKQAADKNKASKGGGDDPVAPAEDIAQAPGDQLSDKEAGMMQESMADGAQVSIPKREEPEIKPALEVADEAINNMTGGSAQKVSKEEVERLKQEQAAKKAEAKKGGGEGGGEGPATEGPAAAEGGGGGGEDVVIGGDGGGLLDGEPQLDEEEEGEEEVENVDEGAEMADATPEAPGGEGGEGNEGGDGDGADAEGGGGGDDDVNLDIGPPPGGGGGGAPNGGGGGGGGESIPQMDAGPQEVSGGGGSDLGSEADILESLAAEHGGQVTPPTPLAVEPDQTPVEPSEELLALSGKNATSFLEEKFTSGQGAQGLQQFTQENGEFVKNVSQINTHAQTTKNFGLNPFEPDPYTPFEGQGFVGGTIETIQAVLAKIGSITGTVADIAAVVGTITKVAGWILSVLAPPVGAALTAVANFLVLVEFICNIVSMACSGLNAVIDLIRLLSTDDPKERAKFAKRFAGNILATAGRGLMAMAGSGTWKIGGAAKGVLKGGAKAMGGASKALATGKGLKGAATAMKAGGSTIANSVKGIDKLNKGLIAGGALAKGSQSVAKGLKGAGSRISAGFKAGMRRGGRQAVKNMAGRRNLMRAVKAGEGVRKGGRMPASVASGLNSPGRLRQAAGVAAQGNKRAAKFAGRVGAPSMMTRMREFGTQARGAASGTLKGLRSGGRQLRSGMRNAGDDILQAAAPKVVKPWVVTASKANGLGGRLSSVFGKGGSIREGAKKYFSEGFNKTLPGATSGNRVVRAFQGARASVYSTKAGRIALGAQNVLTQTKVLANTASFHSAVTKYIPAVMEGGVMGGVEKFRHSYGFSKDDGMGGHKPSTSSILYGMSINDKEHTGRYKGLQKLGLNLMNGPMAGGLDVAPRFNGSGSSDIAQQGIDSLSGGQSPDAASTPGAQGPSQDPAATAGPAPVQTPAPAQTPAPESTPRQTQGPSDSGGGAPPTPAPESKPESSPELGAKVARMASIVRQIECYEKQMGEVQKAQAKYEAAIARQQYLASLPIPAEDQAAAPSAIATLDGEIEKLTQAEKDAEEARKAYTEGLEFVTKKSAQADTILEEARKNRTELRKEEDEALKEEGEQKKGKEGAEKGKKEQEKITGEGNKGKQKGDQTKGTVDSTKPGPGPEPPEEDVPWYRIDKHIVNAAKKVWRATVGKALKIIARKWAQLKQKLTAMIMKVVLGFLDPELAKQISQAEQMADQNLAANDETKGSIDDSKGKVKEMEDAATQGKTDAEAAMETYAELIVDAEEAKTAATDRKTQVQTWRDDMQTYIDQFESTYGITFEEASKASGEDWSAKNHSNVLEALQSRISELSSEHTQLEGEVTSELEEMQAEQEEEGGQEEGLESEEEMSAEEQNPVEQEAPAPIQQGPPQGEQSVDGGGGVDERPAQEMQHSQDDVSDSANQTEEDGENKDVHAELINITQQLQNALGENRQAISGELDKWNQAVGGGIDLSPASRSVLETYDELSGPMKDELTKILGHLQEGGDPASARNALQQIAQDASDLVTKIIENAQTGYMEALQEMEAECSGIEHSNQSQDPGVDGPAPASPGGR